MRKLIASLSIIGALLPSLASAHMVAPGKLAPIGFCAIAQDGTRGVRFDGVSYDAWLALYALANQDEVYRDLLKLYGNELKAGQALAELKKAAKEFQKINVSRGQDVAC